MTPTGFTRAGIKKGHGQRSGSEREREKESSRYERTEKEETRAREKNLKRNGDGRKSQMEG